MAKAVKYINTVGLNVVDGGKARLYRIAFAIMDDDSVVATVENGYTLGQIKKFGKVTMTREELRNMPEDPYNDLVFARAAFSLFGLEV